MQTWSFSCVSDLSCILIGSAMQVLAKSNFKCMHMVHQECSVSIARFWCKILTQNSTSASWLALHFCFHTESLAFPKWRFVADFFNSWRQQLNWISLWFLFEWLHKWEWKWINSKHANQVCISQCAHTLVGTWQHFDCAKKQNSFMFVIAFASQTACNIWQLCSCKIETTKIVFALHQHAQCWKLNCCLLACQIVLMTIAVVKWSGFEHGFTFWKICNSSKPANLGKWILMGDQNPKHLNVKWVFALIFFCPFTQAGEQSGQCDEHGWMASCMSVWIGIAWSIECQMLVAAFW